MWTFSTLIATLSTQKGTLNLSMALFQPGRKLYKLKMKPFKFQIECFNLKGNLHLKIRRSKLEMQIKRTFLNKNRTCSIHNATPFKSQELFQVKRDFINSKTNSRKMKFSTQKTTFSTEHGTLWIYSGTLNSKRIDFVHLNIGLFQLVRRRSK